jgi:hypothetical protein
MSKLTKEEMQYDLASLENGIEKARKNIEIFETAIEKEHTTIRKFKSIIRFLKERDGDSV